MRLQFLRWFGLWAVFCGLGGVLAAAEFSTEAGTAWIQLRDRVMPYWLATGVDGSRGGYVLCDDAVSGRCTPPEKQIVTQARMVWGFAQAHRLGLGGPGRDYRAAAAHGVRFLRDRMRDPEHGGYVWSVTLDGDVRDARKRVYGQAFVIYALVEYHRATRDPEALADAMHLFQVLQQRAHDGARDGWLEHFERDWKPMRPRDPEAIVEVAGLKSANTHLHLMEALTELYLETRSSEVKTALIEALERNQRHFYPADPARSAFHCHPDWSAVTEPASAGLSYGHNVEFAWLMIEAERALGREPSWSHFEAHLNHALAHGTDPIRGGTYNRGAGNEPASDTRKVWWVQAEMMAALTLGVQHRPAAQEYADALGKLILWCQSRQSDPKSGIWMDTVTAAGVPEATGLAHNWKASYHDVRGLARLAQAFGTAGPK